MLSEIILFWSLINYIKSCEFNIDTACFEGKLIDGSMVTIDCDEVEAEYARNMYEASEFDYLLNNEPISYVKLLLSGKMEEYLRNGTDCTPLSDMRYNFSRQHLWWCCLLILCVLVF